MGHKGADAIGVHMNYVAHDDRFWVTRTGRRKRVAAPTGIGAVSSRGTDIGINQAITDKGDVILHDDRATLSWSYRMLAEKVRPGDTTTQDAFVHHLDTPGPTVIELVPDTRIGFDSDAMFANSPAGRPDTPR